MPGNPIPNKKHLIVKPVVDYVHHAETLEKSYRNCWTPHHPEGRPDRSEIKLFQLTNPRISECKKFFEEDVALLENPTKQLGIARRELTPHEKLNLQNKPAQKELVRAIFLNKNKHPEFLLLR